MQTSVPELSEGFYEQVQSRLPVNSTFVMGHVLAKNYLTKSQMWILLTLMILVTITLLNVTLTHSDDDLDKIDALTLSSSLTL